MYKWNIFTIDDYWTIDDYSVDWSMRVIYPVGSISHIHDEKLFKPLMQVSFQNLNK